MRVGGTLEGYVPAEATSAAVTVTAAEVPGSDAPAVVLGSSSVVAGGSLKVSGAGFAAGAQLKLELRSTPIALGTVTASDAGAFSTTVTIPASVPAGAHTLVVILPDGTEVTAAVTVTAAPSAGADAGGEALAQTGGEILMPAVWAAVLALLVGAGLMVRRRLRRS